MILLDTTVLTYAVGSDHPLREPCRTLLDGVYRGRLTASTTPEAIQEFVHVHARRRTRAAGAELGRRYASGLAPLVLTGPEDLERGLRLFENHRGLGSFDAVLAAVALRVDAEALVSADQDFRPIRGLNHVHPASVEFERLVGQG